MEQRQFEVVEDTETPDNVAPFPRQSRIDKAAFQALAIAFGALSQRVVVAIADLFTLLTVGSAFWLWWSTPDPNVFQIVSLSIYALFVLAANVVVRRK